MKQIERAADLAPVVAPETPDAETQVALSFVIPVLNEAESVAGFDFIEEGDFPLGVSRLIELGASGACITSPEGLSYLSTGNGAVSARAPRVETVSTVGSGDAYLAGLLAGLLHRNFESAEAVRLAAGCAAANAETLGAGLFEARRAEELAGSVQVEVYSRSLEESRT